MPDVPIPAWKRLVHVHVYVQVHVDDHVFAIRSENRALRQKLVGADAGGIRRFR
jgi:hypothetical protein